LRTDYRHLHEGAPRRLVGPPEEAVLLLGGLLRRLARGEVFLVGGDVFGEADCPLEPRALVPLGDEKAVLYLSLAVMLFLRDERREVLGSRRRGGSSADALIASPDLLA
jgi:hypothetical protein